VAGVENPCPGYTGSARDDPLRASRAPIPVPRERPAPRRSEVRWYPIHVSQHDPPSQTAACVLTNVLASVPSTACGDVDESAQARTGPSRAVWTARGPRRELRASRQLLAGAAHRLPTLSGLSPTSPQAQQLAVSEQLWVEA